MSDNKLIILAEFCKAKATAVRVRVLYMCSCRNNCMHVFVQYERQLAEYQEKTNRLERRLTQTEQKAATATQQV